MSIELSGEAEAGSTEAQPAEESSDQRSSCLCFDQSFALVFQRRFSFSPLMMTVVRCLKNLFCLALCFPIFWGLHRFIPELIRFVPTQHVPNNRCQTPHDRDSCNLCTTPCFDLLVPRFHLWVFADDMNDGKIQHLSRNRTSCFGDAAESLLARRVMTTRRQAEIICKTVRRFESLDVADSRKESDCPHRADTGNDCNFCDFFVPLRSFDNIQFHIEDLFVISLSRFQMVVDFQSVNTRKRHCFEPLPELARFVKFGRSVLEHVMLVEDTFDFVDKPCSLSDSILPNIGKLSYIGIFLTGGNNSPNPMRSLFVLQTFPVRAGLSTHRGTSGVHVTNTLAQSAQTYPASEFSVRRRHHRSSARRIVKSPNSLLRCFPGLHECHRV